MYLCHRRAICYSMSLANDVKPNARGTELQLSHLQMNDEESNTLFLDESKTKMALPKRKFTKILKIGCFILGIATVLVIITALATGRRVSEMFIAPSQAVGSIFSSGDRNFTFRKEVQNVEFSDHTIKLKFLTISFPHLLTNYQLSPDSPCRKKYSQAELEDSVNVSRFDHYPQACLTFENDLNAAVYDVSIDDLPCQSFHWFTSKHNTEISNCINMIEEERWYGGGALSDQRWPLSRANVPLQPHLTQFFNPQISSERFTDGYSPDAKFDSFLEPYFVSSKGVALILEPYLPLFLSLNEKQDKKICFKSAFKGPYTAQDAEDLLLLKYTVCKDKTARLVHQNLMKNLRSVDHPTKSPSPDILQKPVWSTRGLGTDDVDENTILKFVGGIKDKKLPYSQLFVDGNYSRSAGTVYFNEKKFPHSQQLIMELASDVGAEKFPVGTEVHPEVPVLDAKTYAFNFRESTKKLHWPLDVTNNEAVSWYNSQLTDVKTQISLSGFRFSGGYASDVVQNYSLSEVISARPLLNPNSFTNKYGEIAAMYGNRSVLASGYKSQQFTFVADAGPMTSSWEFGKGLKSVIPTVLTYGIMGYPFVMAGPIGGVNFDKTTDQFRAPDRQLYIRWLQLATYLPVMELSVRPWDYGEEVLNYTRSMLEFRRDTIWPKYIAPAVKEAIEHGTPIARPLWWVAPHDKNAQFINCEFFLTDNLLVAPMLTGDKGRSVYLPEGSMWKDNLRGKVHTGGRWLSYPVGLYEIATFERIVKT